MSVPLYESNAKDKRDVLDWEGLPRGTCDLNFRKPSSHRPSDLWRTITQMGLLTGLTLLLGMARRTGLLGTLLTAPSARPIFLLALVVGLLVLSRLFRMSANMFLHDGVLSVVVVGLGVGVLGHVVGHYIVSPAEGLFLLLTVAVPVTVYAADSLTGHWLHWCSANPRIDRRTMTAWREDWSRRFVGTADRPMPADPNDTEHQADYHHAMRLRRGYLRGMLWLGLAFFAIPTGVIVLTDGGLLNRDRLPVSTVLWVTGGLLLLAMVRGFHAPGSWRSYWRALASWANYGRDTVDPPWVFQSPGGSQWRRTVILGLSVVLLTMAVSTMLLADIARGLVFLNDNTTRTETPFGHPLVGLVTATLLPPLWFVLTSYTVAAPVLAAVHAACEADGAFEQRDDWSELDGYFERLRNSRNPEERRHLLAGYNPTHEYPYLLDSDLLFEHLHMLGATGIGKTALGLSTHTIQLIRRGDGPVVIVDCKGDPAFFHTARIEAERAGRELKWFTNKPHLSTYIFNPLDQPHLQQLTLPELIGLVTQSLNLHHGDDYGRAWFSIGARVLLKAALMASSPADSPWARPTKRYVAGQRPPVRSFRDLEESLQTIASDDEEYKAGKHLLFLVESLADFEQLNLAPNRAPDHPALKHAIHMPEVIEKRQVVYFYLVGAMDVASVGELARMVLYSTLSAAIAHRDRTGERPRVYFVADEAQALAAKNLEMVLAQAREHGLACILAHQTLSQLNPPGGVDLRELVMMCTAVKQYFSARDPELQKYISLMSGTVRYWDASWDQLKDRVIDGLLGRQYAAGPAGDIKIRIQERLGSRLESEDLNDISRNLNESVFCVERASGYSRFFGAFPMHSEFPIEKGEHDRRRERLSWPEGGEATVKLSALWPEANDDTITATSHPDLGQPPNAGPDIQKRLREIRDRLQDNDG